MTTIFDIPNVILTQIFQYLSPYTLPNLVCKAFHQACCSETLWVSFIKEHFPEETPTASPRQQFITLATSPSIERKAMNLGRNLHLLGMFIGSLRTHDQDILATCFVPCLLPVVIGGVLFPMKKIITGPVSVAAEIVLTLQDGNQHDLFEVTDAINLSDEEILKEFLNEKQWKIRSPSEIEKVHMRWFEQVLKSIGKNDLIYEMADWYDTPKSVPVVCQTRVPHKDNKEIPFWSEVKDMYEAGKKHPFLDMESIPKETHPKTPQAKTPHCCSQ